MFCPRKALDGGRERVVAYIRWQTATVGVHRLAHCTFLDGFCCFYSKIGKSHEFLEHADEFSEARKKIEKKIKSKSCYGRVAE